MQKDPVNREILVWLLTNKRQKIKPKNYQASSKFGETIRHYWEVNGNKYKMIEKLGDIYVIETFKNTTLETHLFKVLDRDILSK